MTEIERLERVSLSLRKIRGIAVVLGHSGHEINDLLHESIAELDEIVGGKIAAEYMTGKM